MRIPKILIVDDQLEHLDAIIDIIEETGNNYRVLQAFDGTTALKIAEKEIPDLIITDWEMPVMNGIEFIKQLKSNIITLDIPIIMCTGVMTTSGNLATALNAGAVDYIRKPVDKIELPARINSMLKLSDSYKKIKKQKEEIVIQSDKLSEQNKHITDSIIYASKIQTAILPSNTKMSDILPNHFILFKPRDIVSGDFYWVKKIDQYTIIATADCTGHGVPGAFMSMLGIAFLNDIVYKRKITKPSVALEELRQQVKISVKQVPEDQENYNKIDQYVNCNVNDGMDIALCVIDTELKTLDYSGANSPVLLIKDNQLTELQPTKNPIGIYFNEIPFENQQIKLSGDETLYLFTDGYIDQFGGKNGTKYYRQRFNELLFDNHKKTMTEQKEILKNTLNKWKGDYKQVDDILVMGIKI